MRKPIKIHIFSVSTDRKETTDRKWQIVPKVSR